MEQCVQLRPHSHGRRRGVFDEMAHRQMLAPFPLTGH